MAFVLLLINWTLLISLGANTRPTTPRLNLPYSVFRAQVQAGNVDSVTATGETIEGQLRRAIRYPAANGGPASEEFKTQRPIFANDQIFQRLLAEGATVGAKPSTSSTPLWQSLLLGFGPTILLVGLFVMIMRGLGRGLSAGAGGMSAFGKAKARRYEPSEQRTTFQDVAGIDEATEDLAEVVDFLRHPDRYRALGAQVPRGVLLTGPPGTGKTLLARAVAGEAEVPFFSMSASEFVEMFVGVGASRVRDLFDTAKKEAPAIIFIDELDALGRSRAAASMPGGGHDEREQTLNQVLTEMDGFTGTEGVMVLAATNRPEILDSALLRAGRFDRRVAVNPPDQKGREQILKVHTRSVPLAGNVQLAAIAAATPGMVGADLRNLANEAALLAARRRRKKVDRDDFADALEKIVLGAARHILISPEERERTAYHESGHALLGMLEPGADPVRKISIIPRGHSLGVTFQTPEKDRYGFDDNYLRGRITGMLGGRAAEELVYGAVTTGAESDLEQATALARQMIGRWGMSDEIGLVTVLPAEGAGPYGLYGEASTSERTKQLMDAEVRKIADQCHQRALQTLREHREQLDALAHTLLEHETLDEADAYAAAGIPHAGPTAAGAAVMSS
ncbi:MAG TPA: ATP-dependent zinc metalloprotease FtsH [Solirubrobacteraceae bacterium]|nr:ATP-dependent zinc metalloprotease FtsH [Solirubrobacteraceae bacterium]